MDEIVIPMGNAQPAPLDQTTPPPVPDAPAAPPEPNPADQYATKFAELARRERALQQQQQEYKSLKARLEEMDALEKLRDEDPLSYLDKKGLSYEKLTQRVLSGGKKSVEEQVEELQQSLKARDEAAAKAAKDAEQKAFDDRQAAYMAELDTFVKGNDYELIQQYGQTQMVYDVILDHYLQTQQQGEAKLLSFKEASDLVEEHLEGEVAKALSTKRIKARIGITEPPPDSVPPLSSQNTTPAAQSPTPARPPSGPTTLNNSLRTTTEPDRTAERVSDEELFKRAAQTLRFVQ